jgi:hypothetical protein
MTPLLTGVFASQISGHLNTFTPTGSYDALATYTVPSGGLSSIEFSGIPNTYSHLQIRGIARTSRASVEDVLKVQFNGDTASNYSWHNLAGYGSGVEANASTGQPEMRLGWIAANSTGASINGAVVIDVLDYLSTSKNKTCRSLTGYDYNGGGQMIMASGLWFKTPEAITSIKITPAFSTFQQFSQFSLYGVK